MTRLRLGKKDNINNQNSGDQKIVNDVDETYQCDICDISFETKNDLDAHVNIHYREKPWKIIYSNQFLS